jgi:H+/Cl- antiporter ClcA
LPSPLLNLPQEVSTRSLLRPHVQIIDDNALGSGLPQMKSILSGFVIHKYLSLRTYASKVAGLIIATGAGLSIGKGARAARAD